MEYVLEERIGNPDLFVGRKQELDFYLGWISNIKSRNSQSTAMLARRKMGKTALMQRLFNITFARNDGVIPFYYEIKEGKTWLLDFCIDFFMTFVFQYIAFKTRKIEYLKPKTRNNWKKVADIAKKEGLDYLSEIIDDVAYAVKQGHLDILWETVREVPHTIASDQKEFIVQMIDEFQFLNSTIYRDKNLKHLLGEFAGSYLGTAESKIAPLLVSGSWVGWLMDLLIMMLPARFRFEPLADLPGDEAVEMVFKYSQISDIPVSEEIAYLIAGVTEGSPFYISSIFRSRCPGKDLTTREGLLKTLDFETLAPQGVIKGAWMEYIQASFSKINDRNAKRMVLYLCQNKDRELTRKEILDNLQLDMTDSQLEKRLDALVKADIILQGQTKFRYSAVPDNIFDKVFRGVYQEEIDNFDITHIAVEYDQTLGKYEKKYHQLRGRLNLLKGLYAEYLIIRQLQYHAVANNQALKEATHNCPGDFDFCEYSWVWHYYFSPAHSRRYDIDILARAKNPGDYTLICEVKSRDTRKFSQAEAEKFLEKCRVLQKDENLVRSLPFIYSRTGFTEEAETFCQENHIAYSEAEVFLEIPNSHSGS